MSTFSLFNTAYSGLAAARAALEVTGQNVANVNTPGYTRQRVEQVAQPGSDLGLRTTTGLNIGQGTKVTGIARLSDAVIDARARDTASSDGYWSAASSALGTVETSLAEPGASGLSQALTDFWTSWQKFGNTVGGDAASGGGAEVLGAAQTLVGRIATGYTTASSAWTAALAQANGAVTAVDEAGRAVAKLNDQILRIETAGGSANELKDQRDAALTTLATLAGATTRPNANGTVDVLVGGSTFVSGSTSYALTIDAPASIEGLAAKGVTLKFADKDGATVQIAGGALAARLSALAPAASGGVYAQTAAAYDRAATELTSRVNAIHSTGVTASGAAAGNFFGSTGPGAAALTLRILPVSGSQLASADPTKGRRDDSVADAIGQLRLAADAPDRGWAQFVSDVGARSQAAAAQSGVASSAASAASTARTSQNGVDLDEETANLVVFQHAYQGAARVLTAVDEMLDTLINHTGLVGR